MATCCTNVVLGSVGYDCALTPPSTGKPTSSSAIVCRCSCAQSSQSRSWGNILVLESRGTRRLWDHQKRLQQPLLKQPRTESPSPSFCLPTDVSSDASASTAEGNESGMSIEEKNAIIAFEAGALFPDGVDSEEKRNSSEYPQLKSSSEEHQDQEQDQEALQVMKEREQEAAELKRRASKAVKGQAATVANVVALFMGLLDRPSPGDGRMIGGAGSAVMERVEEEVAMLEGVEGVDRQSLFEILRLVKLLQMDIQLIAAARKDSTLSERLVQTKAHCRQFLNILSML